MDTETPHGQDNGFPHSPWVDMGGFHPSQQSPPMEYHGFGYGPMPLDPTYGVTIPPPYAPLPMTVPSNAWPSMLTTTQPPFQPEMAPMAPVPIAPSVSPVAPVPPPRKSSTSSSTPRRTLTDEDKRQICLYHEAHPTAKQTEIGAMFNVERSTISKVLRQKEKYLNPDDGSRSPIKKANKGRVPDIEKALYNWVRNSHKGGQGLTDEMIRQKALFFASTCGGPDGKEKVLSNRWLEKFKSKNGLTKLRKGSLGTRSSDSGSPTGLSIDSALASAVQSPTVLSPISPTGFASPSPLSPSQSHENIRGSISLGSTDSGIEYKRTHSRSSISLDTTSPFFARVNSPTSTLTESPFTPTSQHVSPTDGNSSRPRSQTFPLTSAEPIIPIPTDETSISPTAIVMEKSPMETQDQKVPLNLDTSYSDTSSSTIKRNRSNPEIRTKTIYPPLFSKSTTVSPTSPPGSPSQDEARRALELVMSYFEHQPAGLGVQEYVTMGKLMERIELNKPQQPPTLPGGLTRIDEHELHDDTPQLNKKRSIHNLG